MRYVPQGGLVCHIDMFLFMSLCFIPHLLHGVVRVYYLLFKKIVSSFSSWSILSFKRKYVPLCSVFSIKDKQYCSYFTFDSDSTMVVTDNSANTHIWNERKDFDNFRPLTQADDNSGVTTIQENQDYTQGIGDVTIRLSDDKGEVHYMVLRDTLFFPKSSVKIMSVTNMAKEYSNEDGSPDRDGT